MPIGCMPKCWYNMPSSKPWEVGAFQAMRSPGSQRLSPDPACFRGGFQVIFLDPDSGRISSVFDLLQHY